MTAAQFLDKGNFNNTTDMLVEFAQMKVKEALEAAREYYKRGQLGFEKAADTEMAFLKGNKCKKN